MTITRRRHESPFPAESRPGTASCSAVFTEKYMVMVNHLKLTGSQSAVLQGTSSLVIQRGS